MLLCSTKWHQAVSSACTPLAFPCAAGVLDGGRIAHGLWGRRPSGRVGAITLLLLSLGGLVNTLALFWALLVRQADSPPPPACDNVMEAVLTSRTFGL